MESLTLDEIIRREYDCRVSYIKSKNIELEREYFSEVPIGEIIQGASFNDAFESFKETVKSNNEDDISTIFMLLQECFLFTAGHDLMFKKKLKADCFTSVPMDDFIYPKLVKTVKEKYNDVSVMKENVNQEKNIKDIERIVYTFTEMQALLNLLYCQDFQFPIGWEGLFPEIHEEIIDLLKKFGITIGDFLHALIDSKCKTMTELLSEITNPQLRKTYLEKVEKLKEEKHKKTQTFALVDLPITYFSDYTFFDFLNSEQESSIFKEPSPKEVEKIIIQKR